MGDVLSAYYLVSHTSGLADIVEGGPSLWNWMQQIHEQELADSYDWYRYCVYRHSSLLRVLPMTLEDAKELGIAPPLGGILTQPEFTQPVGHGAESEHRPSWLLPFRCFVSPFDQFEETCVTAVDWRMSITFNDFGPLGPAFRGRDHVSSLELRRSHFDILRTMFCDNRLHDLRLPYQLQEFGRLKHNPTFNWIFKLQYQAKMNRPMTVVPPFVTIYSVRELNIDVH
jgi:hypothetical protein